MNKSALQKVVRRCMVFMLMLCIAFSLFPNSAAAENSFSVKLNEERTLHLSFSGTIRSATWRSSDSRIVEVIEQNLTSCKVRGVSNQYGTEVVITCNYKYLIAGTIISSSETFRVTVPSETSSPPPSGIPDSGTIGTIAWEITGRRLTISVRPGYSTGTIPDCEDSYFLTRIPWYSRRRSIDSIVIREGVSIIGDMAFYECSALTVQLPSSITRIGKFAFAHCTNLKYLTIPEKVKTIRRFAFFDCSSLANVYVDENNTSFTSLGGVLFNKDLTSVLLYPEQHEGQSYTLPDTVTTIGEYAFDSAKIQTIDLPDSLTTIEERAFSRSKLQNCVLPEGVISIGKNAFEECNYIQSIVIPSTVESIGSEAFSRCAKLETAVLPYNLQTIPSELFLLCKSLKSVSIHASLKAIEDSAFYRCDSLTDIYFSGTEEEWSAVQISRDDGENVRVKKASIHFLSIIAPSPDLIIPHSVKEIEEEAFTGGNFTCVQIPDTTRNIGKNAFSSCWNLRYVIILNDDINIAADAFNGLQHLTIYARKGSNAEEYASLHGYGFVGT